MKNIKNLFLLVMVICLICLGGYCDMHDLYKCKVYQINDKNVLLLDSNDNIWELNNRPDLYKGEKVRIIVNNQMTTTKTDDIIESVRVFP